MKYGLRTEFASGSKKKWKIAMENEITVLKFEISLLKEQLKDATSKIKLLTITNSTLASSIAKGYEEINTHPNENDKNKDNKKVFDPKISVTRNIFNNENQYYLENQVWPNNNLAWPTSTLCQQKTILNGGSRKKKYKYTPEGCMYTKEGCMYIPKGCKGNDGQERWLCCITTMPSYMEQSLEELRMEDYIISDQIAKYGLNTSSCMGTLQGGYWPKYDTEPVFTTGVIYVKHHCITTFPQYRDKSFEELRLEDYILKGITYSNQMQPKKSFFGMTKPEGVGRFCVRNRSEERYSGLWRVQRNKSKIPESPNFSKLVKHQTSFWAPPEPFCGRQPVARGDNDESPRNQEFRDEVLSALNRMDSNMSNMNCYLSTIDSCLSEMSSRMSVMDSRLSAVDLLITIQQINKNWQGLEPRLASLETTPIMSDVKFSSSQVKLDCRPLTGKVKSLLTDDVVGCFSKEQSVTSGSVSVTTTKQELTSRESSNINFEATTPNSDLFSNSPSKMTISQSSHLNSSLSLTSNLQNTMEISLKGSHLKNDDSIADNSPAITDGQSLDSMQNSLTPTKNSEENARGLIDNSGGSSVLTVNENYKNVCQAKNDLINKMNVTSNSNCLEKLENTLESETGNCNKVEVSFSLHKNNVDHNEAESVTNVIQKKETFVENEENNPNSDSENDFVIIEKTDIDALEQHLPEKEQSSVVSNFSSNENKEFKICNDITEYLEINLGKKKDLVYEFGFEANPKHLVTDSVLDCSSASENIENQNGSQESSDACGKKDDSFGTFISNLIQNIHGKQSSPCVLVQDKDENMCKLIECTTTKCPDKFYIRVRTGPDKKRLTTSVGYHQVCIQKSQKNSYYHSIHS